MKCYAIAAAMFVALILISDTQATDISIDWRSGTAGDWSEFVAANWTDDGGATFGTASEVIGYDRGWGTGKESKPWVDPLITIDGIGSDVLYSDMDSGADFSLNSDPGGTGQLVVSGGATLELRSVSGAQGAWFEHDAAGITVTGAGSKLLRTHTDPNSNGGGFVFGSWRTDPGEVIDVKVLDGGLIDNEGQIWFGAYNDSEIDLEVTLEIGADASVNAHGALRGGVSLNDTAGPNAGPLEGDINLIYNWDPDANGGLGTLDDSDYSILMTGLGGMISVGEFGIVKHEESSPNFWTQTPMTYEDLWDAGILVNTNSMSLNFADNFSVTGQPGDALYKITNIVGIPEPTTITLAALGLLSFGCCRRRRAWLARKTSG